MILLKTQNICVSNDSKQQFHKLRKYTGLNFKVSIGGTANFLQVQGLEIQWRTGIIDLVRGWLSRKK